MKLKQWNDNMSDGCSVPEFLRVVLPLESPEAIAACRRHDHAYYLGGSKIDRLRADLYFALALLDTDEREKAELYFAAVRTGGEPAFRQRGVSWAFGGEVFQYSDVPAEEDID